MDWGGHPIACPAGSPDLWPLDSFLWGQLKSLYEARFGTEEEHIARISAAVGEVSDMPVIFRKFANRLLCNFVKPALMLKVTLLSSSCNYC